MTEDTNTIIADAAQTASQAVETAATAVVQTEQAKADSWIDKEWEAIKAEMHAAIAKAEAYIRAKV